MTTYTTIDFPSAISTTAYGINDNDQIVGTYVDSLSRQHGFLLSGGTYTTVDDARFRLFATDMIATGDLPLSFSSTED